MKTYLVKISHDAVLTAASSEDLFTQLHETLRGGQVSLELVAIGQNIAFCITAEDVVAQVVIGQIYAIASDAEVMEVSDFIKKFGSQMRFVSSEISLVRNDLYPLKDYREFEGDSLSGLLSVLSKCVPGELAIVQVVIRAERDSGFHHLVLNVRKKVDKIRHIFRTKYWFKKGVSETFKNRIEEKTSGRLFRANVRVAAISNDPDIDPTPRLKALIGAMSNFNSLDLNQIRAGKIRRLVDLPKFSRRFLLNGFLLSTRELATLFHLPSAKEVPNLVHVLSKKEAPPQDLPTDPSDLAISFFGCTNFRDQRVPFGIKRSDRRRHLYVVGKSGSGKSKLLELLIKNDIDTGQGVGVLDPHGDLVENVIRLVPEERIKDVIVFDPSDLNFPASFNPLEKVPEELKMRVTIGFIEIFKRLFGINWSPRIEHVLRYTTLALLDTPGTTVLSILKMLSDKNYRQMIVRNIEDNVVKNFWVNEFAGWSEKFDNEAITPLLNKVGQFVATNMIRNIVGQPENLFNFRDIMDKKKILLMKVSKGILGEENAALLGAIVVTKVYQAAMSRADVREDERVDFYFYVDEFHNFATDTFDEILSEARKYRLNLTLANQFLGQLNERIRKTVFGNVGSLISFRLGGEDAHMVENEFNPRFSERDIINLGVRDFCIKMSIDGEIKEAFSGKTLNMDIPKRHFRDRCIEHSRKHYARPLAEVKGILSRWEEGEYDPSASSSGVSSLDNEVEFDEPLI
ncbi:MAG: type IV secretory system conjugative DNA transfer family protein [Deltaproteobacteria bacterium]|nr:type IV secretory system conjugative DNA transfer family protein [Deltaproteobacteria bacterium]